MTNKNVILGEVYLAKVSGRLVKVRITIKSPYGGWNAVNLSTRHKVRIKTAARLSYAPLPREYGPSYFAEKMSGFAAAARRVATEEKIFEGPLATRKIQ